jgi:N-acetylneuraminic acid mutarotase
MHRINTSSLIVAALLAIGVFISTLPDAAADTTGVWKLTGSMATSRRNAQRELLPDGRILHVGGTNTTGVDGSASVFHATAEIYDPATGTWTATGSLTTEGRALHTLARLPDGKLLVTGGWNGSAALSSAEIYNPATGTWTATGSMITARANHRDQVLFDGRILITGGFNSSGTPIASAEIYTYNTQTGTGTFSPTTGPMAAARYGHRTDNVGAGKVLVTGGFGAGGVALASSELFNPAAGTFTAAGSLAHARGHHFANTLPTGEILVSGGQGGGGVLDSTELYDPDTGTFTAGATLNQARQSHSAQLLPNGLLLISGGNNNPSSNWDIQTDFLSSAELYDRSTNIFTPTGSKNNATSNCCGTVLWTGKFLSAGGGTNEAELYNPLMPGTSETWVATTGTTPNLPAARTSHQQNLLDDGRLLLSGGLPDSTGTSTPLKSAVLYDYLTGNFTATGDMTIERQSGRTASLYTGKVLVTGGRATASTGVLNSAELYDPATGTFTATGNMLRYRRVHRATELRNGKVLITGGIGGSSSSPGSTVLHIAELYDPATGTFTLTNNMVADRRSHQQTLLRDGRVLLVGGNGASSVLLDTAEIYDPGTGTFSATANNMGTGRSTPNVTLLPSGKVLIQGGSDAAGTPILSIEIYDPATGTFTAAGNAPVARDGNRVVRLDSGKIMSVGGQTTVASNSVTDTVDLYNHVTGTFAATDNLITGRQDFSQTSLPNGRILVVGGIDAAGTALTSAELYTPLLGDLVDTTITLGPAALTTSTSATFTFTSDPGGGTFTCSLDGAPFTACTSGQSYSSLAQGSHNFQVHATDTLGNTDPTPANYDWTVDTVAPDTVIDSGPANPTSSTSANFAFHSTEAGSSFQCQLDSGGFSACTSPKNYAGLALGAHTFEVKATDGAGNPDLSPASYPWTITAAPDTIINAGPAADGGATNSTTAIFNFTSDDPTATFACSLDSAAFSACTSPKTFTKLKVGAHNFKVQATAGGVPDPTPASISWTIDKTAPNTTITSAPALLTKDPVATFTFTSTEVGGGFQCSLDGSAFAPCTSPFVSSPLADGKHNFQVKAFDAASNIDKSAAKAKAWTVDTTRPVTTITGKPTDPTTSTSATFKFKSEKGSTFQCQLDGGIVEACKSGKKYTGLVTGPHTFQVQATDKALNVELVPAVYPWTQN